MCVGCSESWKHVWEGASVSREGERAGGLLYGGLGGARVMGGEDANGVIGDGFVWSA